jgi:signal transduction histidine kinase
VQRGGGEMRRRFREFDWSGTPIGAPEGWPVTWRNAWQLISASSYPLALGLGKELIYVYNDAFIPLGGPARHPSALGQPVRLVWKEIWPGILLPRFTQTLETGEPTGEDDLLMPLFRSGYLEETYVSFSFAPLPDDEGRPSGIFCTATENTGRVIARRQIDCLRRLAANSAAADSPRSACHTAVGLLEEQARDVPFGLVYLVNPKEGQARLTGSFGLKRRPRGVPLSVQLGAGPDPLCLTTVVSRREPVLIEGVADLFGPSLRRGDLIPQQALALPVASAASPELAGILIAGLNPMRPVAESREFLILVAGQLETAISNARARHDAEERARVLAEIDAAKTVFFSNVSHELRTPLTLVLGPLDDVLGGSGIGAKERELLATARRGANRLLKLVNSLLEFSRLEAGRIEASYAPVDLAALTADLASEFRSAFEKAGVELRVDCPALPDAVYVDQGMWERIVLNLLSNACKFTLRGTAVRLHPRGESVLLQVIDTGCGIASEDVPHLFERFRRGHATEARSVEGSGIGLSLVQELVRLHKGTVQATSTPAQGVPLISLPKVPVGFPGDSRGRGEIS